MQRKLIGLLVIVILAATFFLPVGAQQTRCEGFPQYNCFAIFETEFNQCKLFFGEQLECIKRARKAYEDCLRAAGCPV